MTRDQAAHPAVPLAPDGDPWPCVHCGERDAALPDPLGVADGGVCSEECAAERDEIERMRMW